MRGDRAWLSAAENGPGWRSRTDGQLAWRFAQWWFARSCNANPSEMPPSDSSTGPHLDAAAWPRLIQDLAVEAILLVISSWMGPRLRQELTPEDIWQETLCLAWRDRHQHVWRDLPSYRRWILGIARNRIRDAVTYLSAQKRGGGKRPELLSALAFACGDDDSVSGLLPVNSQTPSRTAMLRDRARAMERALSSLAVEYRDAVRLRLFERLPLKEVAKQLGVSLATAKKRVYLGAELYRTALREVLSHVPGSRGASS